MAQEKVMLHDVEAQDEKIYAASGDDRKFSGDSTKEILKSIEWPSPVQAVKSSIFALVTTGIISCILHLYSYGISEAIHMLIK